MVPNSRPWSLLGQSVSYIIKLAPILWWALPAGLAVPHPKPPNASTYDWLPEKDVFSETLEQLAPPQEIQHAVQLQGLLPKAQSLYHLTPKEEETL
ncbi:hypothetical protein DSO57_1007114 [Entomophthora muscae]|uniref:Uncharacterized protein n=1 Tax=Entomophthora muscae TaxID=34485 RepID=A0ACC2TUG1_9FUNG|nr:hypothetical protein DSO57_1007114 [Entomophthora muscae]